jgi:hypothetical protein
MLGLLCATVVAETVAWPLYRRFAAFEAACQNPRATQEALLRRILDYHADTHFARDHGFRSVRTIDDYRKHVPVAPYERIEPYIRRVMKGETSALLADPKVLMFALTSGTASDRKHIPITQQYLDDYRRGWNLWGLSAIRAHKYVFLKPVLMLVGDACEYRTEAGIPCGNLSGFSAQVQKRIVRWMYVAPPITGKIKDPFARTYVALRAAIEKRLGLLVSANPSTLVNLARFMDREKESLFRDVRDGTLSKDLNVAPEIREVLTRRLRPNKKRAAGLEAFANRSGHLLPKDVWPSEPLLIGCWTGGSVGSYLRQLPKYYGDAPIRDLGLLASEGRMSIPVEDGTPSGVLDVATHYFEFIPEDEISSSNPVVLGAHELQVDRHYYIVPTTKAGLYRYHISDLVRVTGFFHNAPTIEFLGKGHRFANLTGEKLSEHHVTRSVDRVAKDILQPLTTYALAPCWDEELPYYGFFIEEHDTRNPVVLRRFLLALDLALGESNIEYESKRSSGRLGPLRAHLLPTGFWAKWDRERLAQTGGAPEQYKHPCLIGDLEFARTVAGVSG